MTKKTETHDAGDRYINEVNFMSMIDSHEKRMVASHARLDAANLSYHEITYNHIAGNKDLLLRILVELSKLNDRLDETTAAPANEEQAAEVIDGLAAHASSS